MTKNDILAYVTETPTNTNRAVLSHMLDGFESGDNKQEIELLAQENKVYTPAEGKVYNKVTVNVPVPASDWTTAEVVVMYTLGAATDNSYVILPVIENNKIISTISYRGGSYTVPLYKGSAQAYSPKGDIIVDGNGTVSDKYITITGDCTIIADEGYEGSMD